MSKQYFLKGILKEEEYMHQSNGFILASNERLVCKFNKSIHRLKQSPKVWYERIDCILKDINMSKSNFDANLYYIHKDGNTIILMLYIDDLFINRSDTKIIA